MEVKLGAESVPAGFERPFRYDGIAYIWDANNRMAVDFNGEDESTPRPRGWGRIGYMDNAEAAMDEWVAWVKEKAGDCRDPIEIVDRMNAITETLEAP